MKYFFLRDERKFPVACVASTLEGDRLRYSIATHNPLDDYDREKQKRIAEGKLNHPEPVSKVQRKLHWNQFTVTPKMAIKTTLIGDIAADPRVPQRARDAAKLWLKTHL